MDESTLRVLRAKFEVEELIPAPWDRLNFVQNIAEMRGRPIELIPAPDNVLQGSPCGMWISYDHHDQIIYNSSTSEYHIDFNITHEVGHMICGHASDRSIDRFEATLKRLLPHIEFSAVQKVLARGPHPDVQESEAELFAELIMANNVSKFRRSKPMSSFWAD